MMGNILLVKEAIHLSQTRGEKGMVIKIDMTKTFDRVNHSFLFVVLSKFGFNEEIVSWISVCISEPWISPLMNGRPTYFFKL